MQRDSNHVKGLYMHTCIRVESYRMHACMHKLKISYIRETNSYLHTQRCIQVCMHAYKCVCMHACLQACIHSYIQKEKFTIFYTHIRTYIHTYIHAYIRIYMHTYIHTYHTYTYEFIHAYIQGEEVTISYLGIFTLACTRYVCFDVCMYVLVCNYAWM